MQSFTITIKSDTHNQLIIEADGPDEINVIPQPFNWQPTPTLTCTLTQLADEKGYVPKTDMETLGQALYDALFNREIAVAFSQAQARVGEKNLRLRLQIEPPELAALPWEAMRNQENWLGLDGATPLVRVSSQPEQKISQTLAVTKPLRILFVGASPNKLARLDVEGQATQLRNLLADAEKKRDVALETLFHPTAVQLRQELLKDYHVIYFAGHGEPSKPETSFDGTTKINPAILFVDGQGQRGVDGQPIPGTASKLNAESLATMLKGRRNTRIVFLAACNTSTLTSRRESDKVADTQLLDGFAQELMRRAQLPAIIAMQYYISDQQAIPLAAQFFAAIAQFTSVDIALADARAAIVRQGQPLGRDVFAPVLYLQAEDGALFKRAWNRAAWSLAALLAVVLIAAGVGGYWLEGLRADEQTNRLAAQTREAIAMVTSEARETARVIEEERANVEATRAADEAIAKATEQARADDEERVALSRRLGNQANEYLQDELDLALLLSTQAIGVADTFEARDSLLNGLEYSPYLQTFLYRHVNSFNQSARVVFKPDSDILVSVSCAELSSDGSCINNELVTLDTSTYKIINKMSLQLGFSRVGDIDFALDGTTLLVSSSDPQEGLKLIDVGRNIIVSEIAGDEIASPKGVISTHSTKPIVAFGGFGNGQVQIWDYVNNRLVNTLPNQDGWVIDIEFSPTSDQLVVAYRNKIMIWQTDTLESNNLTLIEHSKSISDIAFDRTGKFLVSAIDDKLIIWRVSSGEILNEFIIETQDMGAITKIVFSEDSSILAVGGMNGLITLWDTTTLEGNISRLTSPLIGYGYTSNQVQSLSFGNDNTLASVALNTSVRLWQPPKVRQINRLGTLVSTEDEHFIFVPDNRSFITSRCRDRGQHWCRESELIQWDITSKEMLNRFVDTNDMGVTNAFALANNGQILIAGSCAEVDNEAGLCVRGEVSFWDTQTGDLISLINAHNDDIDSLAYKSQIAQLVTGGCNQRNGFTCIQGEIIFWDATNFEDVKQVTTVTGHTSYIHSLKFIPNNQIVGSSGQDTLIFWDTTTQTSIGLPTETQADWSGTYFDFYNDKTFFYPDYQGNLIFHTTDNVSTPSDTIMGTRGSGGRSIDVDSKSRWIATGHQDGSIILWDAEDKQKLQQVFKSNDSSVTSVHFNNDSSILGTIAGTDLIFWDTDLESWKARACRIANRNLTLEEWQTYLGDAPYRPTCPDLPIPTEVADTLSTPNTTEDILPSDMGD